MRIALIHAVTVAIAPVHDAFARLWPAAECIDILDNSLSLDREHDGELTAAMTRRIEALADYAASTGAAGSVVAVELPALLLVLVVTAG